MIASNDKNVNEPSSCKKNEDAKNVNVDEAIMSENSSEDEEEETNTENTPNSEPDEAVHTQENNEVATNSQNKANIKKGDFVHVKGLNGDETERNFQVVSRAGKAKGKYKNCWNVQDSVSGEKCHVDLDKINWSRPIQNEIPIETPAAQLDEAIPAEPEDVEECLISSDITQLKKLTVLEAKMSELSCWKDHKVYEEVVDEGQETVSTRWVISEKIVNGQVTTKARLCARGFEEVQDFRKDSPTCSKETIRVVLALASSHGWSVNSLDVSRAFLQGDHFDRTVYVKPPKEAKTDKLWKLLKCVYGLADASRQWYLTLLREIHEAGGQVSAHDGGLFFCHTKEGELIGLMPCHVDDVLWSGTKVFEGTVVKKLNETFLMGTTASDAFAYVGIELKQNASDMSIVLSQESYTTTIQLIEIDQHRKEEKTAKLSEAELTQLRGAIGQLNWLSCTSRPDIAFDVSFASSNIKGATVNELTHINKVIKKVKQEKSWLKFPMLDINSIYIRSFADASYNNLKKGGSQGGHVIFLADRYGRSCPIEWKSNKLKRVVRSPLAAEALACADCIEADIYWANSLKEITKRSIKVVHHTDSQSLVDNLASRKTVTDKLLRVDINVIKENAERNGVEIKWIEGEHNLSDVMTKAGVNPKPILDSLRYGKVW